MISLNKYEAMRLIYIFVCCCWHFRLRIFLWHFCLNNWNYKPYHKPDNEIYIHKDSNHPFTILKQIPTLIDKRISTLSSNEIIFNESKEIYQKSLEKSGYRQTLKYHTINENASSNKRNRKRNAFLFKLPFSVNVKTEVGNYFLNLIRKHFPLRDKSCLGNRRNSKQIIMFSDSIPKGIRIRKFNHYINNATAGQKSFPGATSKELSHYVVPTLQEGWFNSALINIGINGILKNQSGSQCESFTRNILEISHKCKEHGVEEIIISSIVATENIDLNLLARVNASLCNMCRENGFCFLDNSNISSENLFKDKLHLLDSGKNILVNNFIYCINNYYALTHTHTPHITPHRKSFI